MKPHFLTIPVMLFLISQPARAETNASPGVAKDKVNRDLVKVAAVQISGYDKGDLWREGYDAADQLIPYIERAGQEGAQLVVFPEYILGRIQVPGPTTRKISAAAAAHGLYVIVGCWEVYDDASFANTALVFDRTGTIVGKYHKTHAAVDHYSCVLGLRNSYDKSCSTGLCIGASVFVCDNLSFRGSQITFERKHTTNLLRDLSWIITETIATLPVKFAAQSKTFEAYRETPLTDREAHDLVIQFYDKGAVENWSWSLTMAQVYRLSRSLAPLQIWFAYRSQLAGHRSALHSTV
jgi:Carbon-nitrogen hydrolase